MKYSNNPKTNAVLNAIEEQLKHIHDTEEESLQELKHYMQGFPKEIDYNLYQYGNVLIYDYDIRQMYLQAGYKAEKWSADKLREAYKRQVGYVAKQLIANSK